MSPTIRPLTAEDAEAVIAMNANFVAYLAALGDPDSQVQHFTRSSATWPTASARTRPLPAISPRMTAHACGYLLYCKGL